MSNPKPIVVRSLYRSILRLSKQLHRDIKKHHTVHQAVCSGKELPGDDQITKAWNIETQFHKVLNVQRNEDIQIVTHFSDILKSIRHEFHNPSIFLNEFHHYMDEPLNTNNRIDLGFFVLRALGNHNHYIQKLNEIKTFETMDLFENQQFNIGNVVTMGSIGRGVIIGWSEIPEGSPSSPTGSRIQYHVLLHNVESKEHEIIVAPEHRLELDDSKKPIQHLFLPFYFDGYENGSYIPCRSMYRGYNLSMLETKNDLNPSSTIKLTPSILQIQNGDEKSLYEYLQSNDETVVKFSIAALEGRWLNEKGQDARIRLEHAMKLLKEKQINEAENELKQLMKELPEWTETYEKLGLLKLAQEKHEKALFNFEKVLELNPKHIRALNGLGTCCIKLKQWAKAREIGYRILKIQPNSIIGKRILENVDKALYELLCRFK